MKPFITRSALLLLSVAFVGCAGTQSTQPEASETDTPLAKAASSSADHHEGEANVLPHDDSQTSSASSDHHEGEANVPEHDDSSSSTTHIDDPNEPAHGHSSSHDDTNEPPHRD